MTRKPHKTSGPHRQPYQYNELPRDGSFRYLILHRGTGNDPLKCSLRTAPVSKTKFEAISYVWGKSKKNKKIFCDGRVIKITKSLSDVLRRLRLPNKRRKLWADGICINQNELEEKGHQVAIMGEIYRSAKCVLISIGSNDHGHGPQVCSLLDDVGQMIDETCKQTDMTWNSFPYPAEDDRILLDSRWNSLHHLFYQNWFKRGWVVREAAFAQYGLVIWHQSEFSWETLMSVYMWLLRRAFQLASDSDLTNTPLWCHLVAFMQRNKVLAQPFFEESFFNSHSLLENLDNAKPLQLSNACDRIYAFMELSGNDERVVTIHPNYSLAPLEVYRQFSIQYIQDCKDLNILNYVSHGSNLKPLDIPSWIPRWDVPEYSMTLHNNAALSSRNGSFYEPTIIDHEVLSVKGIIADTVRYISDTFEKPSTTLQTVGELWKVINPMLGDSPYEPSHRLEAFLDALCCGIYDGGWSIWRQSRAAVIAYVQTEHEESASSTLSDHESIPSNEGVATALFLDYLLITIKGCRFIVTNRGYMGLAPAVAQKGDLCGIVFGCKMPCALRSTYRNEYYKFLGATSLIGKQPYEAYGGVHFVDQLGNEDSKDWLEWDVEEQDIYLV